MPLQEYEKYETIWGKKVHLFRALEHEEMLFMYGQALAEILEIEDKSEENIREQIKDEQVIHGLIDTLIIPGGDWHSKSWKCLWANTWWTMWRGKKIKESLAQFDIKIEK